MRPSKKELALVRSLARRKNREETRLFVVEGLRLCEELLRSGWRTEMLLVSEDSLVKADISALAKAFGERGIKILETESHQMVKIADTVNTQGVIAVAEIKDAALDDLKFGDRAVVVALDAVSDPGNTGAVIRTAAWFGADAVLLGEGCADLFNPKSVRSTMGGMFHIPVCRRVNLPKALKRLSDEGFRITGASAQVDSNWRGWAEPARAALIMGSEAHGLSEDVKEHLDNLAAIPGKGKVESLNIAVAAGIFLAETA